MDLLKLSIFLGLLVFTNGEFQQIAKYGMDFFIVQ